MDEFLGWGVAANVVQERLAGPDLEVRRGLKHFAGGAKVWISLPFSGDGGERLYVVGRHRGSHRYIRIIIQSCHLEHARAKAVYSPAVHRLLAEPVARMLFDSEEDAADWAAHLNTRGIEAHFDGRRWYWVPDPPPMEFELDGKTYYLAHFNHRRARYSSLPPPHEP
ncbi:hypothetical protein [Actinomadura rubrisoli]|uniref:Uncharacterized protein n=1 Tax=Actinomadura rubrisoli TaxID=2530368 RepID=A0A4R5C3X7_9ACTN|nr:hypothetical protein [Actinomadura rubrisoli]TDD92630.1 hypothetical protein E1298_10595 [Actinomadura rubrisoli]